MKKTQRRNKREIKYLKKGGWEKLRDQGRGEGEGIR